MEDYHFTVQEIAEIGTSIGSADSILKEDLSMNRVATKYVPKQLSLQQRQLLVEVSEDMVQCTHKDPEFLKTAVAGD